MNPPCSKEPCWSQAGQIPQPPEGLEAPTSIRHLLGLVNQNCMTSCVMAAEAQRRPDPVFVLKLIGDSWMMEALRNA